MLFDVKSRQLVGMLSKVSIVLIYPYPHYTVYLLQITSRQSSLPNVLLTTRGVRYIRVLVKEVKSLDGQVRYSREQPSMQRVRNTYIVSSFKQVNMSN